jgi:hypothetical protein
VRWKIVLPVALPALLLVAFGIVLIVLAATGDLVRAQISIIMGVLATPFIALPLVIFCVIPYALFGALAALTGRLYANARGPIYRVRDITFRMAQKTDQLAPKVAQPTIALNTRVTRWEHMLRGFQEPSSLVEKDRDR